MHYLLVVNLDWCLLMKVGWYIRLVGIAEYNLQLGMVHVFSSLCVCSFLFHKLHVSFAAGTVMWCSCEWSMFFILPVVAITYRFFTNDYRGPRRACILYWVLQLAVGVVKSFSVLRCSWINNFILAFASSVFSFCFETWLVLEHEKVCVFF